MAVVIRHPMLGNLLPKMAWVRQGHLHALAILDHNKVVHQVEEIFNPLDPRQR
jgi:hypothetical protein